MACKCGSDRIVKVNGKTSDMCSAQYKGRSKDGVPYSLGIGGGDYIDFAYCLDCGKIQGSFPIPVEDTNEYFGMAERISETENGIDEIEESGC